MQLTVGSCLWCLKFFLQSPLHSPLPSSLPSITKVSFTPWGLHSTSHNQHVFNCWEEICLLLQNVTVLYKQETPKNPQTSQKAGYQWSLHRTTPVRDAITFLCPTCLHAECIFWDVKVSVSSRRCRGYQINNEEAWPEASVKIDHRGANIEANAKHNVQQGFVRGESAIPKIPFCFLKRAV